MPDDSTADAELPNPTTSEASDVVVVPHKPGPLAPLGTPRRRPDDLDDLIDEMFGRDDEEQAGWFDVALLAGGAGLGGWGFLLDGPSLARIAGVVMAGLGVVLPTRTVWRKIERRRRHRQHERTLARGIPLLTTGPEVAALTKAYDDVLSVVAALPPAEQHEARHAAHGCVMECASLLQGRAPGSDAQRHYVEARATALEAVAKSIAEVSTPRVQLSNEPEVDVHLDPTAVVEARNELDELTGLGSLQRLDRLTDELRDGGDDARA